MKFSVLLIMICAANHAQFHSYQWVPVERSLLRYMPGEVRIRRSPGLLVLVLGLCPWLGNVTRRL